jgi:nitrogenase iron protein NifH
VNKNSTIPTPIEMDELEALLIEFGILDDDSKHAAPQIGAPAEATK